MRTLRKPQSLSEWRRKRSRRWRRPWKRLRRCGRASRAPQGTRWAWRGPGGKIAHRAAAAAVAEDDQDSRIATAIHRVYQAGRRHSSTWNGFRRGGTRPNRNDGPRGSERVEEEVEIVGAGERAVFKRSGAGHQTTWPFFQSYSTTAGWPAQLYSMRWVDCRRSRQPGEPSRPRLSWKASRALRVATGRRQS